MQRSPANGPRLKHQGLHLLHLHSVIVDVVLLAQLPVVQKIKGQYLEASKANRPAALVQFLVGF